MYDCVTEYSLAAIGVPVRCSGVALLDFCWAGFCSVVVKAVRAIVSGAHPWSGASRQVLVACPVHRALVLKCPPPVTA